MCIPYSISRCSLTIYGAHAGHQLYDLAMLSYNEEKKRPSLPLPEAGTTLFIRNLPFLATEDELRTL